MRGWRLTVLETLVAVAAGIALTAVNNLFGSAWMLLGVGIVVFGFGVAQLLATDAFISAYPTYILGLESERVLRIEFRVFGMLMTTASLAWIASWFWAMSAGGGRLPFI